jgi:pilus assembly protein CpaF
VTQPADALVAAVRRGLRTEPDDCDQTVLASLVRDNEATNGSAALLAALERVSSEVYGAGPLERLLRLADVTDVLVNGAGPVWVDDGDGLRRTDVVIEDETTLRRLAQRIVEASGRRLDDAVPFADARLPDGTRVHAVLPPLSPSGTCLSLRVPPRRAFTMDELVAVGSLPPVAADLLCRLVERKLAFVVTGGTGSGKTTVLSTLLSLVDPRERIVLVEDAAELRPSHPHVVRLEARQCNAEGAGGVALDVLVRQALRMRPDRLVVGEVRGPEVVDLLTALNTGHEGGCSTIHANRAEHVPARFEALCGAAGMDRAATHSQLLAALDVVIHLRRTDGKRKLAGVGMVGRADDGHSVVVRPAFACTDGSLIAGPAAEQLRQRLDRH